MSFLPLAASENALNLANSALDKMSAFAKRFADGLRDAEVAVDENLRSLGAAGNAFDRQQMVDAKRREIHDAIDRDPAYRECLKEANSLRETAERAAQWYGDDLRLAEITTIDDPKRAHYSATVRGAGHAALVTLAEKARSEKDLALAVALAQEIGPLKRNERPFDPAALVRDCLPEVTRTHQKRFREAVIAYDRYDQTRAGIRPTRNASTGDAFRKIQAGLRDRAAGMEPGVPPPPRNSISRIQAGLIAREGK